MKAKREPDKIIFQSAAIRELVLTDRQLAHLRQRFPSIKSFHPEILKAEAWLLDANNQEKFPTRMFVFICNWIENSIAFGKERAAQKPGAWNTKTKKNQRLAKEEKNYKFEPKKPETILKNVHSLGDILAQANQHNPKGE